MCYQQSYHQKGHSNYRQNRKRQKMAKWQAFKNGLGAVPVNIQEQDEQYELHLFAAGYQKEDFTLSIVDHILKVTAKQEATETPENARWKRKEFQPTGFVRAFELNDKINTEAIAAAYKDGVLVVTLPKLEGQETVRQTVEVK